MNYATPDEDAAWARKAVRWLFIRALFALISDLELLAREIDS